MRSVSALNDGWIFRPGFDPADAGRPIEGTPVGLPHTAVELPFSYFDETLYQRAFTYQRTLAHDPAFDDREVALRFDGAMADSVVYLNGTEIGRHTDGYTPFTLRLTEHLRAGDNLLTVKIDGSENPAIPPFGGPIDYLTYAGLYREAWLEVTAPVALHRLKIETAEELTDAKALTVRCELANPRGLALEGRLVAVLADADGREIARTEAAVAGLTTTLGFSGLAGLALWDIDSPTLYEIAVTLETAAGTDRLASRFGFRTARFTAEGFELNGRKLKLRGLNRHQAYPYTGYAMGRAAQERDAEILKRTLKVNLVRTSHYPQSPWFLDHCDRIGLLVFEEIPGWQHIGDEAWQARSADNVEAMITRDWNHPSIIIWGVRINESADNHAFYAETNRRARALDPTRQTGGVRYITESEMLEDVYTMNDFVQGSEEMPGANRPRIALRDQREVTGLKQRVPYMVTEFNGHMFPTKRGDQEQRQAEHVRRHLAVLDAMYGDPSISGAIGWCMADYNTHKDFGSGDRICHHGVMDMFREPKFAAYAYASQCEPEEEVILKPVTYWARGERNIGGVLPLIVLTNCDEVELRYGAIEKRVGPDRETYPNLPHPPVVIDHRHFSGAEMGLWGMRWLDGLVIGYRNGVEVARVALVADPLPTTLEIAADRTTLAAAGRDSTRVIVRALDQAGHVLPFFDESVAVTVTGPARRLGPAQTPLRGGTTGFWIETTGEPGAIRIAATCPQLGSTTIDLTAG
ncbi:glycoside hydrolase family 2 protein [Prosthecomicrobium pneumaticum]|uniref:Beta-galactosidase n=1 Tax=Prosthecomicrobium pneumaticum TaxID=81895 RepID=A0A7W9FLJ3_9HYPH|nr:glycoside hydrolase family 2 protein [Prosthecomicrobium pneumaticum]MBB5752897.1 beta-galactosidase [Prosthecomicrobium pneumaticum]